jgi:hypothetical protein
MSVAVFVHMVEDDTVLYQWRDPPDSWNWQTSFATFSRPHHYTHTHTPRPRHGAPLAPQPLLRRQRVSSVFSRTGPSGHQRSLPVVLTDGGNTNTKGQALS